MQRTGRNRGRNFSAFSTALVLGRLADLGALVALIISSNGLLDSPTVSRRGFSAAPGVAGTGGASITLVVVAVPVMMVRVTTVRVTVGVNFLDFFFEMAGSGTMMSRVLLEPQMTGLADDGIAPPSTTADTPASSMARPFKYLCIVPTQPRAAT